MTVVVGTSSVRSGGMRELSPSQRRAWTVGAIGAGIVLLLVIIGLAWPDSDEPWQRTGPTITVSGWIAYWQVDAGIASFDAHRDLFADVSIMAYAARDGGSITPFDGLPSYAVDQLTRSAADGGVDSLATIFDQMAAGGMAALLADPAQRSRHVADILAIVDGGGFDGVDLDYEQFAFADARSTWATTQPNWVAFLTELAAQLHQRGKVLVVSVPPIYDDGSPTDTGAWVYDYAAMGRIVDRIRVMAYDYSVGEPGPIAPIEWVRSLVDAITDLVPPSKVDLGIPVYGRDWPVSTEGVCPTDHEPATESITTDAATALLASRSLTPVLDADAAEMRADYTDVVTGVDATGAATACTVQRTLWYLDAAAIQARAQLAWRHDLHGVVLWALGNDNAATWSALVDARLGLEPGETLAPSILSSP